MATKKLVQLLIQGEARRLANENGRFLKKLSKLKVVQEESPLMKGGVVIRVNPNEHRKLLEEVEKENRVVSSILYSMDEKVDASTLFEWSSKLSVGFNSIGLASEMLGFCSFTLREVMKKKGWKGGLDEGLGHAWQKFTFPKLDEVAGKVKTVEKLSNLKSTLLAIEVGILSSSNKHRHDAKKGEGKEEKEGNGGGKGNGKPGKVEERWWRRKKR